MSQLSKDKLEEYAMQEEEETLKEVCSANGLSFSRLAQEGQSCVRLEMFFNGYQRMIGLQSFPNLQVLCIVGQVINRIEGLECCPKLKELWVAECQLTRIEGLGDIKHLRRLYLYSNAISKIEGVSHLSELETLWVNDNEIAIIEGISELKHLKELNLSENDIEKIGNSLNGLNVLEKVELSGNRIYSLKDLTNLQRLPNLVDLGLKSPMYRPNPVGLLCNYSTYLLFHLPHLHNLDTMDVTSKSLKELAETTVLKKKMYYNMKSKTVERNHDEVANRMREIKEQVTAIPVSRISALYNHMKEIEREIAEMGGSLTGEATNDEKEAGQEEEKMTIPALKAKHALLKERVKKWQKKMHDVEMYFTDALDRTRYQMEVTIQRLISELETGGNVRYEDGRPTDMWLTPCHDLLLSRFCAVDYRDYGIVGLKIHRIMRVHNRILRTRFDDALAVEVDDDTDYFTAKSSGHKKLLEYMFWVWEPEIQGEPGRVLEEGFMDDLTYKQLGKDAAVPLTNSLHLADRYRMSHVSRKSTMIADPCPFRHGQVIIAKVYIGKSAQCSDTNLIEQARFPKADSVFRPKKHETKGKGSSGLVDGRCECVSRQCEWFVFNNELVMPEYVVDFEYITKVKPKSAFAHLDDTMMESRGERNVVAAEEHSTDDDLLQADPVLEPRPRLVQISEAAVLQIARVDSLANISSLNLHGNGLHKVKYLQHLPNLRSLIISFNELTRLDDLAHLKLKYLDASFNKIATLEGWKNCKPRTSRLTAKKFPSMMELEELDLSWNKLHNTRDDVSILRKHCPALHTLDLRHNNWQKPDGLRLRAIGRIKLLKLLNGEAVTESEKNAALRMAAGSRISQVSLLSLSRTDQQRPRTLSLESFSSVLCQISRNKPDRTGEQDNIWYSKVTTLNLNGQHISKLSNLDRLLNLKWASFNNNDITKIEGLDTCLQLEQLSLEHNCISRLEGLSKLTKLKRLSLSHNYITHLDNCGLERLTQLQYLSIDSNAITSLLGLQRAVALQELYIGNNQLSNIRELFYLKNLPSLVIVDLYGNPLVTTADNYRLFVIYHLKSLKALDGTAIESCEGGQAKDAFGGRLTQDFVAERLGMGTAAFNEVRELDFPQCSIRNVDLGNGQQFLHLRSVNLEHNNLTSLSGLVSLINLKVLCLNHNHIECVVARPKQSAGGGGGAQQAAAANLAPPPSSGQNSKLLTRASSSSNVILPDLGQSYAPVLENLEVLHLGYNGIKDLSTLQLGRLPSLKALFLQGNEISKVEGLEGLHELRELVLDRNKVKNLTEYSFMNQWKLQELHMEENRVRDLAHLSCLEGLQRLFLGMNRIQELAELEKLDALCNMVELSLVSNAVARRMMHRPLLIYRLPSLQVIDGIRVTEDERAKAEMYFNEQQPSQMHTAMEPSSLPGIGQYKAQVPVKVTNMQLMSSPYQQWSATTQMAPHFSDDMLQHELSRVAAERGHRKRGNNNLATLGAPLLNNSSSNTANNRSTQPTNSSNNNIAYARSQQQLSQVAYVPSDIDRKLYRQ